MNDLDPKKFSGSINFDRRLFKYDIKGSIAHVEMLHHIGIISAKELTLIVKGLNDIEVEIENDSFVWDESLEDLHMNIENRLFEIIGPVAGKMHTARSRNDQVVTDLRMFVKDSINELSELVKNLQNSLINKAEETLEIIIPGYTHLQRAQPILIAHQFLAHVEALTRDASRLKEAYIRTNILPLGSGALAGTTFNTDRELLKEKLNFKEISLNSIDAVSDRDFVSDLHYSCAMIMIHISQLAEELILWSTKEFDLIYLSEKYITGSSMMPQKRNPDYAELGRGKTGRVIGNLVSLLTMLKGLPHAYNRDLQEDKENLFDTIDTAKNTLTIFVSMVDSMKINKQRANELVSDPELLATDFADLMVQSFNIPFRQAYHYISKLCRYARENDKDISDIKPEEYAALSDYIDTINSAEVLKYLKNPIFAEILKLTPINAVKRRNTIGGTSPEQVKKALKYYKNLLIAK